MESTLHLPENGDKAGLAEGILEQAQSIDPELASSLTTLIDDEVRRYSASRAARALELRQKPSEIRIQVSGRRRREPLADAAHWMLQSVETGRGSIQSFGTVSKWLQAAALSDIHDGLPVATWAVENWRLAGMSQSQRLGLITHLRETSQLVQKIGEIAAGRGPDAAILDSALDLPSEISIFDAGQREAALLEIKGWIEDTLSEYLTVVDPYFTFRDLDVLSMVPDTVPVYVIAALSHQIDLEGKSNPSPGSLREVYSFAWQDRFDQDPPPTQMIFLSTKRGRVPIHDRYMFTKGSGLRFGTSVGGIGKRQSEISRLSSDEAAALEARVADPWKGNGIKVIEGERVLINSFPL